MFDLGHLRTDVGRVREVEAKGLSKEGRLLDVVGRVDKPLQIDLSLLDGLRVFGFELANPLLLRFDLFSWAS